MKKITVTTAGLALALLCSSAAYANAGKDAYAAALKETNAAIEKAASVEGEWRDIRWKKSKHNLMGEAAKAAKAGDYKKAMDYLKKAKFQADMGYQQAMDQKNAGPLF